MGLALQTTRHDKQVTVTARGSIDLHSSDELRDCLGGLLESGERRIVVDLTWVDFCDSSGLNVLVRAYKHARARDVTVTVAGARGRVENVLRTTGLDRFLMGDSTAGDSAGE